MTCYSKRIPLVRGNTLPQVKLLLSDEVTGLPMNLTGASALLKFREAGSTETIFSRALVIFPESSEVVIPWAPGDLDVDAGDYEGEIEVTYTASGLTQSVYELIKFKVREAFV